MQLLLAVVVRVVLKLMLLVAVAVVQQYKVGLHHQQQLPLEQVMGIVNLDCYWHQQVVEVIKIPILSLVHQVIWVVVQVAEVLSIRLLLHLRKVLLVS
jgi:hypothetical protein